MPKSSGVLPWNAQHSKTKSASTSIYFSDATYSSGSLAHVWQKVLAVSIFKIKCVNENYNIIHFTV